MAVELIFQTKAFRRHAFRLAGTALTVGVLGGFMLLLAPQFTANAARAMTVPQVKVTPLRNGLASIQVAHEKTEANSSNRLDSAQDAGSRLSQQFSLESAGIK